MIMIFKNGGTLYENGTLITLQSSILNEYSSMLTIFRKILGLSCSIACKFFHGPL